MEFIIISIVLIMFVIILKIVYKVNIKEIKLIAENSQKLDGLVKKYPSNVDLCKIMLKRLKNETVIIEEDKNATNCLYIALTNKIIIANLKESFTRIQTIAHECIHSVQDRKVLIFNFIFSNINIIFFSVLVILGVLKLLPYKMMFLSLYIITSFIFYFTRSYLENDAMIKAKYLAETYMNEIKISSKEEINEILDGYDRINFLGIKAVNYGLFLNCAMKILILAVIFLIR